MPNLAVIELVAFGHLEDELNQVVAALIVEIRTELAQQGHNLSGDLSRSITQRVTVKAGQIVTQVEMLRYGQYQNEGVKPSRIPFGRPSRAPGTRSAFISALQDWVIRRGIETNDKLALRIAFAIAKKMKSEGMPTRNARRFSRNGRRKGFMNIAVSRGTGRLTRGASEASARYVTELLDGTLRELDREIENLTYP